MSQQELLKRVVQVLEKSGDSLEIFTLLRPWASNGGLSMEAES
jgi:hypothetical protein